MEAMVICEELSDLSSMFLRAEYNEPCANAHHVL